MAVADWILFGLAFVLAVAAIVLGIEAMIYGKEDEETWLN